MSCFPGLKLRAGIIYVRHRGVWEHDCGGRRCAGTRASFHGEPDYTRAWSVFENVSSPQIVFNKR